MSARNVELRDEILALPPRERARLAEEILNSLTPAGAQAIEQMCAEEAEARLDAYERGEIEAISGAEAIAWLNEQSEK